MTHKTEYRLRMAISASLLSLALLTSVPCRMPLCEARIETGSFSDNPSEGLSFMAEVFVRRIDLEGNRAIGDQELRGITASYENRSITFDELQALRRELTLYYVNKGFVTSGAVIPDQKVDNGVIVIRIVEGTLREITITGAKHLKPDYLRGRILSSIGPAVNTNDLQRTLLILQQNPMIKRINAELKPAVQLGESLLQVSVEENSPYEATVEFGNLKSPTVGEEEGILRLGHHSLTGNGDVLSGMVGITEGLLEYDISYSLPVNARDTTVKLQTRRNQNVITEPPFDELNIENTTESYGITVSHPFYRNLGRTFSMGMTGEYRHSASSLLGRPFSFSPEADNGVTSLAVSRIFQEYIDRGPSHVLAARSTFNVGTDPAQGEFPPSDVFFTWVGQVQWIRRLGSGDWQLAFRTDTQLTTVFLPASEKFSIGGLSSVRGYRENRLTRDNGVASSIEVRVPVIHNRKGETTVQLIPFFDIGASWNAQFQTPDPLCISSIGVGLKWCPVSRIEIQLFGSYPFTAFEDTTKSLQDMGFQFRVIGRAF